MSKRAREEDHEASYDHWNKKNKDELLSFCKEKRYVRYSHLKREELIQLIVRELTSESHQTKISFPRISVSIHASYKLIKSIYQTKINTYTHTNTHAYIHTNTKTYTKTHTKTHTHRTSAAS